MFRIRPLYGLPVRASLFLLYLCCKHHAEVDGQRYLNKKSENSYFFANLLTNGICSRKFFSVYTLHGSYIYP